MDDTQTHSAARGGRGARARILGAATRLFYEQGISTTGVKELADVAHVSTRSFYQHFASKDDLIAEYLSRFDTEHLLANEEALLDLTRSPTDRLLGLFAAPPPNSALRGCPFHNAAVEAPALPRTVSTLVMAHKEQFLATVIDTAREAGCRAPKQVGFQLVILYEGAAAWCTSTGDAAAVTHARRAAKLLIQCALPATRQ